ncbi:lipase 3-like [Hyposmocoma kahamanoa]|uniref:lipase 3-like n=1 Tax=Hyposmocoma kahamanoa TaxID=1477025 RepID=UPI000E6D5FA8|nr:lipase 3-like [Hyposmocoma kahamanoa]
MTSEQDTYTPTDLLIREHGKRCTTHTLLTKDGYELTLHRLINPIGLRGMKQTILMHHGLLGSSADWILLGPEKSLPYYLSTLGYDVWFANARGNRYSQRHQNTMLNSTKYYDFSWQEIGLYDLPAIIDYVRRQTNEPLNFIGHSMGATALLVLLSSVPKYNDFLRMAILLGPLVYMKNIKGPLRIISLMTEPPLEDFFKILGNGAFVPSRKLPDNLLKRFCLNEVLLCGNPLFFMSGVPRNHTQWSEYFTKLLFQHIPAGGSTKTFLHYAQLVKSGKFHKFGEVDQEFPLKEVTTPVALISSSDDWLASIPDLVRLYINIFNPIEHYIIRDRNISHTDFVWGPNANKLVFPKVIELLQTTSQVVGKQANDV